MDRRQFLQFTGIAAAATSASGCTRLTPRYTRPERFVAQHEKLLLTGAKLIDTAAGKLLDQSCLLIANGKIAEVLTEKQAKSVTADRTLDLNGHYVIPGLINAHCHMSMPGGLRFGLGILLAYERQIERHAEECVKHGVTTVRDMFAVGDMAWELKNKIGRGEVLGPRMILASGIDIEDAYGDRAVLLRDERFYQTVEGPQNAIEAVKRAADGGADFIKVFQQRRLLLLPGPDLPTMDIKTLAAINEEAARLGMVTAMHHTGTRGLDRGIAAGITSFEHMVANAPVTEAQINHLLDNKITVVPTNSVAFALAYERKGDPNWGKGMLPEIAKWRSEVMPQLIREFCEPELIDSTIAYHRELSDPQSYESWHLVPWPDQKNFTAGAVVGYDNLLKLHEAGVTFGCGNDGGVPLIFPGALAFEMQLTEKIGLTPAAMLRAATVNNAKLIGMQDSLGAIGQGFIADLVVTEKDPLATTANLAKPSLVIQNGQPVYRA
jgi:imidazolonepropionase-like amidohydrolase